MDDAAWRLAKGCGRILVGLALLLACPGPALASGEEPGASDFETARIRFERNATDGDVEVVFEVQAGDEGLTKLTVVSPDGRTVLDLTAPDASTLGIRQFGFESPEPKDVEALKEAYPQGVYSFAGATAAGQEFRGESTLSHELPATASFLRPAAGAKNVSVGGLGIRWSRVRDVSGYIIEIGQDELDVSLEARLPGSLTTFSVPDGFLLPATEYGLGIGTIAEQGNVSFVETSFTTAEIE